MCRVLDNSLFVKDRKKYIKISECATSFNSLYNKNNIIQDDIFNVLENYVARHDMPSQVIHSLPGTMVAHIWSQSISAQAKARSMLASKKRIDFFMIKSSPFYAQRGFHKENAANPV